MGEFQTRLCVPCLVLLGLALAFVPAARAQSERDVFTVSGIPVDVTADDAVNARQEALLQGQRDGLARLLRRLVPAEEHGRLPPADTLPVERFVQNFEITREEVSSTQYIAELDVAYSAGEVRDLLQSEGLPFAETASSPLVVLPVYEGPDGTTLWPDGNPWWAAWSEELDPERLLRLVLPLGDLQDMAQVSAEDALRGDPGALLPLAERYGSEDVLVVTARTQPVPEGQPVAVEFEAQRIGRVERIGEPLTLRGEPGQPLEDVLREAVRRLQTSLDEQWKFNNLLRFDQGGLMVVDIPITTLSDWVRTNRGLNDLPEVSRIDIASFARDNVRAEIHYIGDEARLDEAVGRLGLTLSQEGETWRLLRTGASPEAGEAPNARPGSSSPAPG